MSGASVFRAAVPQDEPRIDLYAIRLCVRARPYGRARTFKIVSILRLEWRFPKKNYKFGKIFSKSY